MIQNVENRNRRLLRHIVASYGFKGGTILLNFLLVPLSIQYLGQENYGIWLVVSSFISWFAFLDFGIGNGLRNTLTEIWAKSNFESCRPAVSVAYISLSVLGLVILVVFFLVYKYIDWHVVFNIKNRRIDIANTILLPVVLGFVGLLVFKLINSIFFALQKASMPVLINFITQFFIFASLWILNSCGIRLLKFYAIVVSIIPVACFVILNLYQFNCTSLRTVRPSADYYASKHFKSIFGVGLRFFMIQLFAVILYSTDNMIITHLFSPKDVVPYNTAFKYFSVASILFGLTATPYWSAFSDAYFSSQIKWIQDSIKKLQIFSILVGIGIIVMFLISSKVYSLWLKGDLIIPNDLSLVMALFILVTVLTQPYIMFINGTGKIRMQLLFGAASALINVPLSIFFAKYCDLGPKGVIVATLTTALAGLVIYIYQYSKLISGRAVGVWSK